MLFSSLVPFLCFQKKFRRSSELFKSEEQLEKAFFQISPDHRTNNCFSFILLDFTLIFASHFHPTQIASRLSFKLSLYDRLVVPSYEVHALHTFGYFIRLAHALGYFIRSFR